MKKRNRYLAIILAAALLLTTADAGIGRKKADAAEETATAYLEFIDGSWGKAYKALVNGEVQTDPAVSAEEATVDGNGVYRLALDFAQTDGNCAYGITRCIIRIENGEEIYSSESGIQVRSVKITNSDGKEDVLEGENIIPAYTYADSKGQTSLCLYGPDYEYYNNIHDIRDASGQKEVSYGDWQSSGYRLLSQWSNGSKIQKIEVIFAFAKNTGELTEIPADATPKPNTPVTPGATASSDPGKDPTATPQATASSDPGKNPTATPQATASSNPGASIAPSPTKTPQNTTAPNPGGTGKPTATPQSSVVPSGSPNPSGNIASNSTYTGEEKIFVNKSAVVVAAGSHTSVTIALLRAASSVTQVTVSSGNSGIAVPTLQPDGKLDIAVPATASAGSSTAVTLNFGSSSAAVKVTVSNPVTQIKGAKKAYKIKRKKTAKVSVNLTPKNTANAMTDTVTATISKKKVASVASVKVSGNKATIKVKALKKGSAKLKVKAGGKSASIKIKVK